MHIKHSSTTATKQHEFKILKKIKGAEICTRKKILSLFLAVMFIAGMAAPVYALESGKEIYKEKSL